MKCNAKTRSGTPCKRSPAKGSTRCRLHGGATPKGPDSPHFKHGMYSKYISTSLGEVLAELDHIAPEQLTDPSNEIKLLQALILTCQSLQNDVQELKDVDVLSKIIDRLISAKQRSLMIHIEEKRLIPASDISRLLDYIEEKLSGEIGERKTQKLLTDFANFKLN